MNMTDKYFIYSGDEYEKVHKIMFCKSEQEINNCLHSLKDWIKKEAHLPQNEDDYLLCKMLMLNKFSVEKTKGKLETYYTGKNLLPEFFENYFPKHKSIQGILKQSIYLPFPRLTPTYERVALLKLSEKNLDDFNAVDFIRMVLMSGELRLFSKDISTGDVLVVDMAESTMQVLIKFSPRLLHNSFTFINGAFTDRIRSMNFINVPPYAYTLITLVKSLLKSKLAERVHVHKDLDSLYEQVPKTALPKDYGGEEKSVKELHSEWRKYMESQNSLFVERSKLKSNEKLRVGNPIQSELFGLQGSFQKLVID